MILGGFGPLVAAVAVSAWRAGWAGVRGLLGRVLRWRVGLAWYAVVLVGPFLYQLAGMALHALLGGQPPDGTVLVEQVWSVWPAAVYMLLLVGPAEEVGWRGFLLPALQVRLSALGASFVLGLVWAVWHLPLFFNPAMSYSQTPFVLWLAFLLPYAVLHSWVYNSTDGSLLPSILLHAMVNATGSLWRAVPEFGATAAPDASAIVRVYTLQVIVLWILAAIVLLANGPRNLARRPRQKEAPASR
jgi:membrane protease YdiL (CAAX protease family)